MDGQFNLLGEGYDYAGSFEDGYAPVKIKDKWFVIDKNFNICGNKNGYDQQVVFRRAD